MRRLLLPLWLAAMCFSPCSTPARAAPPDRAPATRGIPDEVLTLDRAVALAVTRSFALSAASNQVEAAAGAAQQAGLPRNPSFSALVEDMRRDARTATATIDVPLELGGKRAARTLAAERAREAAEAEFASVAAAVKATVTGAFFDVLVAQERLELARDSAAIAVRGTDVIAKRVAAGKVSPIDATKARIDEVDAALEVDEADTALRSARQALASTWNDADLEFATVEGNVEALIAVRELADLQAEVDRAPAVVAGRLEVARQRALLDVEKRRRIPDLTVTMGVKRDNELGRTQAVVGLSVPLPLFDRNQGGVYEAARRADKAEDEHHAARIRVLSDLRRSSNQLVLATRTAGTLKTVVLPAAEDAFRAASRGYEAGKFGFLDVIDARRTLLAARTRYLIALSTSIQAATTIDRLLGR